MNSRPYIIKADKSGQQLLPIEPEKKHFSESWLQELIQSYPDILPAEEIEPVFSSLVSIGREIPTASGYIDNLLISEAGYPVLVETKLWRNAQAKREVIAQALDYAGELSRWSFADLDEVARKKNNRGVLELIQEAFDPDPEKMPTEDIIAKNLRLGRFLILIVSDQIRSSLVSMLDYINRYPHLATNVGLVELRCYQLPENRGEMMVVPSMIAKTEIVERSIVRVILEPDQPHSIHVQQIREDREQKRRRDSLTEEVFWESLEQEAPASIAAMRQIYEHYANHPLVYLKMRRSGVVVRMVCPDSDQSVSLLILYTGGTVECWPDTILGQLEKAGLDQSMGEAYRVAVSKLLSQKSTSRAIYQSAEQIDLEALFTVVDEFAAGISKAVPTLDE